MTNNHDELERVILQAVANDYEEFEMIASDVAKWMGSAYEVPDIRQIQLALMKSIADGDVKAYEPSETSGQLVVTQADPERIRTLWFYVTEQGKRKMESLGGG